MKDLINQGRCVAKARKGRGFFAKSGQCHRRIRMKNLIKSPTCSFAPPIAASKRSSLLTRVEQNEAVERDGATKAVLHSWSNTIDGTTRNDVQQQHASSQIFLHSPQHSGSITTVIGHLVSELVESSIRTPERIERACHILGTLAKDDDYHKVIIASSGGIRAITLAMRNHPHHIGVQREGCNAFGSFYWRNPSSAVAVLREGGIDAIITAMRNHPRILDIQTSSCRVLEEITKFCSRSGGNALHDLANELLRINAQTVVEKAVEQLSLDERQRLSQTIAILFR